MFQRCSDGSCGPGGFWRSFQMKVWTLMVQRNSMIPSYLMIPGIRWSPAIPWSIGSIGFDNPKVYGDTSISDGLVYEVCLHSITFMGSSKSFCFGQYWRKNGLGLQKNIPCLSKTLHLAADLFEDSPNENLNISSGLSEVCNSQLMDIWYFCLLFRALFLRQGTWVKHCMCQVLMVDINVLFMRPNY